MRVLNNMWGSVRRVVQFRARDGTTRAEPDYLQLIQRLPHVIFQSDAAGDWTFLNNAWSVLTGFSVEESLGQPQLKFIHPKDQDRCSEHFKTVRADNSSPCAISARYLTRDGDYRWLEVCAQQDDSHAGGLSGTLTNITNRVHDEKLFLATHRTLTGLINDLPGMVYRCRNNRYWTMEYVSGGARELTGYEPDDMINNKALSYASLIHPDDELGVWNDIQHCLANNQRFELVYRIITAQREEKWVWERGEGIFTAAGELLGLEGLITDITHSKRSEARARRNLLYDQETGLPTPGLFFDRLQAAVRRASGFGGASFSVLLLQLDHSAKALAKYGSKFAVAISQDISKRLQGLTDPTDTISHLEVDRFGVLLERSHSLEDVNSLSQGILEELLSPICIENSQIYVTASIGIVFNATGYRYGDEVMRHADVALHHANALGGGRQEIFDPSIEGRTVALSQIEN